MKYDIFSKSQQNNPMGNNALLEQLLAQKYGNDPQYQAMLSMFQQSSEGRDEDSVLKEEADKLKGQLSRANTQLKQLSVAITELESEVQSMQTFQEDLAHALGACVFCWGHDPSCRGCRGRGKPGAYEPDAELFQQYVAPALRRRNTLAN